MEQIKKRIDWIDIYKGLAILLMVIGHSTGLFNAFIYQFHLAAFFFISGYTSSIEKKTIGKTIYDKIWSLLIPFFTVFFLFLAFVWSLNKIGWYQKLFTDPFIGVKQTIINLFSFGDNYIMWMGAGWFIAVLFGVFVIQKILITVFCNKFSVGYMISCVIVYLLGFYVVHIGYIPQWSIFDFDLIFIGQLYFGIGAVTKKYNIFEELNKHKVLEVLIFIGNIILLYYFAKINPTTVDYPSRAFGTPVLDVFAAVNGIVFCFFLAVLIEKLPQGLKKIMIYLGKNTLGIVFFHFMFFKLTLLGLFLCGIVPFEYMKNFLPGETGEHYWLIFSVISIGCSLLIWKILNMIPPFAILLGNGKSISDKIYEKFCNLRIIKEVIILKGKLIREIKMIPWKKFNSAIRNEISTHKQLYLSIGIFLILVCIPLAYPRIVCNDELQSRFWSLQGPKEFFRFMINSHIEKGRALSTYIVSTTMYTGFIGIKTGLFRIIPSITIILNIILFGILLYKIFSNKYFAIFTSVFIFAFIPITFEVTAPNAFTALYNIPFMFLLAALILYVDYLLTGKFKFLALSMFLFFVSMISYEMFITYTPLFLLLAIYKLPANQRNLRSIVIKWIPHSITSFVFLGLYFVFRKLFPSNYDGNQIGGFTLSSSLAIISQLFRSSFPGYFLINNKYRYLMTIFSQNKTIWQIISLRSLSVAILLGGICWNLFSTRREIIGKQKYWHHILIIACGLSFIVLPTFPLAISKMYQGNVNDESFTALPITFFTYFAAAFVLCYIFWIICSHFRTKYAYIVITIIIVVVCLQVQCMNDAILEEQISSYSAIESIESVFETDAFANLNKHTVYSADLYETHYALAILDGYWTEYAKTKGLDIELSRDDTGQELYIAYPFEKYFIITDGTDLQVLSHSNLEGKKVAVLTGKSGIYLDQVLSGGVLDHDFYVYSFTIPIIDINGKLSTQQNAFVTLKNNIGTTLQTCKKIEGFSEDGWVTTSCRFQIMSQTDGKISVSGYYPKDITGNEIITAYIDDTEVASYTIEDSNFSFEVPCDKNSNISLTLKSNFSFIADAPDSRTLSFVLCNLKGT